MLASDRFLPTVIVWQMIFTAFRRFFFGTPFLKVKTVAIARWHCFCFLVAAGEVAGKRTSAEARIAPTTNRPSPRCPRITATHPLYIERLDGCQTRDLRLFCGESASKPGGAANLPMQADCLHLCPFPFLVA